MIVSTVTKQSTKSTKVQPPAKTLEARENQMIALAFDQAETELRNKSASSQVVTHYLKLGTLRSQIELETLREQNKLIVAKTEQIKSTAQTAEMFKEAIAAMRQYNGNSSGGDKDDY